MERKDPKDMTASELLRWAANGEPDEHENTNVNSKLFAALGGKPYKDTTYDEDARNILTLADQIDAEIEAARMDAVALKPMWWFWCAIKRGEDWPKPRDGEKFREYLSRCFILRPRDEDGEPVQFGDCDIDWESLGKYRGQGIQWNASAVDARGHILATTADPYKIVTVAKTDERGRVKRRTPEVLGADGLPVVAGETVYTETGLERVVTKVGTVACDGMEGWEGTPWVLFDNGSWLHATDVTHTRPDTQESLDQDARKLVDEYWGCYGVFCADCPAKIDGKTPAQRHNVMSCQIAKAIDLLRRQRELDARKGGTE